MDGSCVADLTPSQTPKLRIAIYNEAVAQTPLKKCPQCGALAYMNAQICQNCNRQFQTTNTATTNQTQVFVPSASPFLSPKLIMAIGIPAGTLLVIFFTWVMFSPATRTSIGDLPYSRDFHQSVRLGQSRFIDVAGQFGEPDFLANWSVGTVAFYNARDRNVAISFTGGFAMIVKDYAKDGFPFPAGELTSESLCLETPSRMLFIDFFNLHGPGTSTSEFGPNSPIQSFIYNTKDGSVRVVSDHGEIISAEKR